MADFYSWDRTTLEQFAREATAKLIENKEAIEELVLAVKLCMEEDASEHGISIETILLCHEATSKHESTTKEQ